MCLYIYLLGALAGVYEFVSHTRSFNMQSLLYIVMILYTCTSFYCQKAQHHHHPPPLPPKKKNQGEKMLTLVTPEQLCLGIAAPCITNKFFIYLLQG